MIKIRLAIIVNSEKIKKWEKYIIDECIKDDSYDVVAFIIPNHKLSSKRSFLQKLKLLVWYAHERFDELLFKPKNYALEKESADQYFKQFNIIKAKYKSTRYSDYISDESLREIEKLKADVIIRFGFRILRGEILKTPKYGVLSLHHGNPITHIGGPPCYWEFLQARAIPGVMVQRLTEKLDAGEVINLGLSGNHPYSLTLLKNKIYWKGANLFLDSLKNISRHHGISSLQNIDLSQSRFYKAPKNFQAFLNLFIHVNKLFRFLIKKIKLKKWRLLIYFNNEKKIITNAADPFICKINGLTFIFYEKLKHSKGRIDAYCLETKLTFHNLLNTGKHESFPYIFCHNDQLFLLPETNAKNQIAIYPIKYSNFHFHVEEPIILLGDVKASDSVLFFFNGLFWLFTSISRSPGESRNDQLFAFFSSSLSSNNWKPHTQNPIIDDPRKGRNGGSIFRDNDGNLIRTAQNAFPYYGNGIDFYQITDLTPISFNEIIVEKSQITSLVLPKSIHTFNKYNDEIIAYDYY